MSEQVCWHHPSDDADQWDGFNEPGIEHFAGSPILHLAREVNQNALDAKDGGPVKVLMRLHEVETSSIPDLDQLKENFNLCRTAAAQESEKARIFFESAIAELNKKKIHVLEVSDHNTTGMMGPSTNGTPYYAFMKAKGQSRKPSEVSTGSFGIGKFAPYAVSKIRTVFVSTVYQESAGNYQQLTQGKSILMSHDLKKKRRQGAGFWGIKERCQPVFGVSTDVPGWLARAASKSKLSKSKGTKLSILCFDATKNWQEKLAVSVAENFFGAINDGQLEVDVNGKYQLTKDAIPAFFHRNEIRGLVEKEKNEPEHFDNCAKYLLALQEDPEVLVEESETQHLGLCQLRILVREGFPKKVCALRNGMLISDSLSRLKNFSDFKEFVAVVECKTKKGNELLRAMEPPRHDDFEPDRLPTKDEQRKGAQAIRDLSSWIREMLKRHAKDPVSEITALSELKEYFSDESSEGRGKEPKRSTHTAKLLSALSQ